MSIADSTVKRFSSLVELQVAHDDLLARRDQLTDASDNSPEFWAAVGEFLSRAQATGALLDVTRDRRAAQSILDYWANMLYRAQQSIPNARLAEFDPVLAPELPDEPCPYQGLAAFEEDDAEFFFGRDRLVQAMIDRLRSGERLLVVVGSSGSGKSSVVLAGLLSALRHSALPGSEQWYTITLVPGSKPLDNLAHIVLPPAEVFDALTLVDKAKFAFATDGFRRASEYLADLLALGYRHSVVLVVDQFEELFTLCDDEQERQAFVNQLIGLIETTTPHVIVLTMRTDFVDQVVRLDNLWPLFRSERVDVDALDINELRAAIELPAARVGLRFEEGIIDDLISTILGERAGLPLLQFTLLKLWQNRQRNRITRVIYGQIGNPRQALERSAEAFYTKLIPEEQRTVRHILLRLVRPSEGREFTSNRIRVEDLFQNGEARDRIVRILHRLVNEARLLKVTGIPPMEIRQGFETATEVPYPDVQVEVAHEALVRNWSRLVDWLDEEREQLQQRLRLHQAVAEWERLCKSKDALLRGALLEEAKRYRDLSELETEFVAASEQQVQAEREAEIARQVELAQAQAAARLEAQRSRRKTSAILGLSLLLILIALVSVVFGFDEWQRRRSPWQPVTNFPHDYVTSLTVAHNISQTTPLMYCASTINIGIGCSLNGVHWNIYQQGFSTGEPLPKGVGPFAGQVNATVAVAIDHLDPNHLVVFVSDGQIYKSLNGGVQWQPTNIQFPNYVGVWSFEVCGALILAAATNGSLYVTHNDGETWEVRSAEDNSLFSQVHDVEVTRNCGVVDMGAEGGLYQSVSLDSWQWQQHQDVGPVLHLERAEDEQTLFFVTFDEERQVGKLYRRYNAEPIQELITVNHRPFALTVASLPAGGTTTFLLLNNGDVLEVSNNGTTKTISRYPPRLLDWAFNRERWIYWSARDLLAVPIPSQNAVWLLMGHSDGLLEYQLSP